MPCFYVRFMNQPFDSGIQEDKGSEICKSLYFCLVNVPLLNITESTRCTESVHNHFTIIGHVFTLVYIHPADRLP